MCERLRAVGDACAVTICAKQTIVTDFARYQWRHEGAYRLEHKVRVAALAKLIGNLMVTTRQILNQLLNMPILWWWPGLVVARWSQST